LLEEPEGTDSLETDLGERNRRDNEEEKAEPGQRRDASQASGRKGSEQIRSHSSCD